MVWGKKIGAHVLNVYGKMILRFKTYEGIIVTRLNVTH